jgi:RNA polymerase sigma-70 factor (ECF subfamily)
VTAPSDYELLYAWRAGDQAAGDGLARRHYGSVHRFFDVKVPHVAEDLTQQTFLACIENRDRLREGASFRAYLFAVARHRLLDYLRQSERVSRLKSFGGPVPASVATPSRVVARRQEQRLLLQALDALVPDMHIAITLFYWEGMSTAEIADVLDVSVSAVTTRLGRARARLRETVERLATTPKLRESLLGDIEGWTRSLAGDPSQSEPRS